MKSVPKELAKIWPIVSVVAVAIGAIVFVLAFDSANAPSTTWSIDVPSPHGDLVALGRSYHVSGPGSDYGWTEVAIQQRRPDGTYFGHTVAVLDLHPTSDLHESEFLRIKWGGPSYLELLYRDSDVTFQAVKWQNVTISARSF